MSKRPNTLDAFISRPAPKRSRIEESDEKGVLPTTGHVTWTDENTTGESDTKVSSHHTYPFAVPHLPPDIHHILDLAPAAQGRIIDDQPDLDLLYYQPYVPNDIQRALFEFLRRELFVYRVRYMIKRGPVETPINTPRFTTVFGLDETARFGPDDQRVVVDAKTGQPVPSDAYKCQPRPIPQCLDHLRTLTERATGERFNFCLVNYYATGDDSISYHSDDERFLGNLPAIASFTLGAKRDFLLRHKPTPDNHPSETKPMKLPLASGDMILMRGLTQRRWRHAIPKRRGGDADQGRLNITFRRAMVRGGTENYYRYNVGDGEVYKWDEGRREMSLRH